MKIECPRCKQDFVATGEISKFQKKFYYCPECEACWDNYVALTNKNQVYGLTFSDLPTLLSIYNLSYSEIVERPSELVE